MTMITSTTRLQLDELVLSDAPFILQLLNEPGWLKYIGDRGVSNLADAEKYIMNGPQKSYGEHGFGLYKVSLKNNTPIGICGLLQRDYLSHPDIGFAFLEAHNGQGYALEAAQAIMRLAKTRGIQKVFGITLSENKKSIKLLEKLGLQFERMMETTDEEDIRLYST